MKTFIHSKKFVILISISAAILLSISGTFIYKHTFTNPLGIDNEFYKERVHVYEIVMTAYNEKREFTPFETREIEDILGEVLDDTGKTEDDYENEDEFFLDLDISIMYLKYKIAMNNIWDDSERSKKLKEFIAQQKTTKVSLGL